MGHHLLQIIRIQGIQDGEEVLSGWALVPRKNIWEILLELKVLLVLGPEPLDGELIVMRDLDRGHRLLLEELLLSGEHGLQEVLVDMMTGRQEVLEMFIEVNIEIKLGLQFPLQLLGLDMAEGSLLRAAVDLL